MILGFLQRIGRSLMLPIAVLPAAAILVRLGADDMLNIPFVHEGGNALLDPSNMGLIFAIGVAIGFSKDGNGAAALSGTVAYLVLNATAQSFNEDINMNVLGGILSGIVAGLLYNRFYRIQLPDWLAFFGGRRFVPIVTSVAMVILGGVAGLVWPSVQNGINSLGQWIIHSGAAGVGAYGFFNRLLIPTGLHHVINTLIWFDFGTFKNAAGDVFHGDIPRFLNGDPKAGIFTAGFFPVMMFGLPGACLAMYVTAKRHRKKVVGGFLFGLAFTSFLTGVTETIEFSFMFLAPFLYVIHAVLAGTSLMVANLFGIHDGFGFSASFIDYLLNFNIAQKPLLLLAQGIAYGIIYFIVFYLAIRIFNIKTPGRENEGEQGEDASSWLFDQELSGSKPSDSGASGQPSSSGGKFDNIAYHYLQALGGKENIDTFDSCATRLRLKMNDMSKVDEAELKRNGAAGIMKMGKRNLQVVVGTQVEFVADAIRERMDSGNTEAPESEPKPQQEKEEPSAHHQLPPLRADDFVAPLDGKVIPLTDVDDDVFSQKMMGDGLAIEPTGGSVASPVNGKIINIFPTKHAIGIRSEGGYEIMVHLGLDTVKLNGQGFDSLISEDQNVSQGQEIMKIDLDYLRKNAPSTVSPIVFTNLGEGQSVDLKHTGEVKQGTTGILEIE